MGLGIAAPDQLVERFGPDVAAVQGSLLAFEASLEAATAVLRRAELGANASTVVIARLKAGQAKLGDCIREVAARARAAPVEPLAGGTGGLSGADLVTGASTSDLQMGSLGLGGGAEGGGARPGGASGSQTKRHSAHLTSDELFADLTGML